MVFKTATKLTQLHLAQVHNIVHGAWAAKTDLNNFTFYFNMSEHNRVQIIF